MDVDATLAATDGRLRDVPSGAFPVHEYGDPDSLLTQETLQLFAEWAERAHADVFDEALRVAFASIEAGEHQTWGAAVAEARDAARAAARADAEERTARAEEERAARAEEERAAARWAKPEGRAERAALLAAAAERRAALLAAAAE